MSRREQFVCGLSAASFLRFEWVSSGDSGNAILQDGSQERLVELILRLAQV
ncbi:hypothetical protein SBA3_690027 [Candidatus Sulfopaludibacter sp. SbA3]|nr:hypothetical protein SBA3_690027 [Candidatus Sulfopaludibacter sp. SbA3]